MEFNPGKEYKVYGKVISFNFSDGNKNALIVLDNDENINLKLGKEDNIETNGVYRFDFKVEEKSKRKHYVVLNYQNILDLPLDDEVEAVIKKHCKCAPVSLKEMNKQLSEYIKMIKNKKIKMIVEDIFARCRHDFLIYPAAIKMHHHYIGGLAYHTLTMVKLALAYVDVYDCLDRDYLIAGALLHDIAKVKEFSGPCSDKYSNEGQLLGHLVMGALEIEKTAERLNVQGEESLLLEHMVISHHGQLQYGAAKRPETPEAVLLWLLDMIDSKLRVVDETFDNLEDGTWSEAIGVLEKTKFYKRH